MHPMLVHPYFRGKGVLLWDYAELAINLTCGCSHWNGVSRENGVQIGVPIYVYGGGSLPNVATTLELFCDYLLSVVEDELDAQKVEFDGGRYTKAELLRLLGSAVVLAPYGAYNLVITTVGTSWIYMS